MNDPLWDDAVEWLPDGSGIMVRDVRAALSGEDFRYYPDGSGMPEKLKGVGAGVWASFFSIYRNWQRFGLPNNAGWLNELPWVLDFLSYMDDLRIIIENWRVKDSARNSSADSI